MTKSKTKKPREVDDSFLRTFLSDVPRLIRAANTENLRSLAERTGVSASALCRISTHENLPNVETFILLYEFFVLGWEKK